MNVPPSQGYLLLILGALMFCYFLGSWLGFSLYGLQWGEISGLCCLDLLRRDRSWILVAWRGWSRREMNIDYLAY